MMNNESREATKTLSMRKKIGLHVKEEERVLNGLVKMRNGKKQKHMAERQRRKGRYNQN